MEKPGPGAVRETDHSDQEIYFSKGDEIGRFVFGSTVILLFPENTISLEDNIQPLKPVKMGEKIGLSV